MPSGSLSYHPTARGTAPLLEVVGADLTIPLVPTGTGRLVHLDYAASAPPLRTVADKVAEFLPWYASVHRGAGFPSTVSSAALAAAREEVQRFVGARADDVAVFTRNTTDSLNLLAHALPADTTVLTLDLEHHANLLPWRSHPVRHLPTPPSAGEIPALFDQALAEIRSRHTLVAVTGASNVTGEILPIGEIVAVTQRHGARVVLDAAQLAPHRQVDISSLGVDYVAFSGHKLYAPFGAGVLVGRRDWLDAAAPWLAGGGAVETVTVSDVRWASAPARHEGGTPNVVGAIAIAAACRALGEVGFDAVKGHESELADHLQDQLATLGTPVLRAFSDAERVGIATIDLDRPAAGVAAALSAEYGIATRDGAFCAHPLMRRLAGVAPDAPVPNALRVSIGVGSTTADINTFAHALFTLLRHGPRLTYSISNGRLLPSQDPRPLPSWLSDSVSARSQAL